MTTVKMNSQRTNDLLRIVAHYERNAVIKNNGESAPIAAYRPLENMQKTLEATKNSLRANNVRPVLQKGADAVTSFVNTPVDKINDALSSIYKGKTGNRDSAFAAGPVKFEMKNTVAGILNSKSPEEAFNTVLQDCIPCDIRLDGLNLAPSISFLENLLDPVLQIIAMVQSFTLDLLKPQGMSLEICATLNLLNFTCIPDFKALKLGFLKGIQVNLNLPGIKLPTLGDLASLLMMPLFGITANIAETWTNLVIKPMDCVIESLTTQIKKLEKPPIDPPNNFYVKYGFQLDGKDVTKGELKPFSGLDASITSTGLNKETIDNIVNALKSILNQMKKVRNQVLAFMKQYKDKFQSGLNSSTRILFDLLRAIQEVIKLTQYFVLLSTLESLFESGIKTCEDRSNSFEEVKKVAAREFAKSIPGNTESRFDDNGGNILTKKVQLTEPEIKALGLDQTVGKTAGDATVAIKDVVKSSGDNVLSLDVREVEVTIRDAFTDCISIAHRRNFTNVSTLIESI